MFRRVVILSLVVFAVASLSEVAAAEFPPKVKVAGHELILNGMGSRKKTLLQLYLAGLYLTDTSSNPEAIIAGDATMAIRIEITSGFVSQEKMVAALSEGFESSTNGNTRPLEREIQQFRQCFAGKITKGDVFEIVYVPSRGSFVVKNGEVKGVVEGLPFKQALFGIWLSDKPADQGLKNKLLGG